MRFCTSFAILSCRFFSSFSKRICCSICWRIFASTLSKPPSFFASPSFGAFAAAAAFCPLTELVPFVLTFLGISRFSTYLESASSSAIWESLRSSVRCSWAAKMGCRSACNNLMNSWFRSSCILASRCISCLTASTFFSTPSSFRFTRSSRAFQRVRRFSRMSSTCLSAFTLASCFAASSFAFSASASLSCLAFSASFTRQRARNWRYSSSSCSSVRCSLTSTDLRLMLACASILASSSRSLRSASSFAL
mmetsp:Transcript_6823/g.14163  ORF Transcript_6823/g.14163 Transcript_6823/m.14163 type:complete len:250 (+) Transcript_6823:264-1013(+)